MEFTYVEALIVLLMVGAFWKFTQVENEITECKQVITHLMLEQINDRNTKD